MRQIAHVGPGDGGPYLDADARRSVPELSVVVADLHLIHACRNWAERAGHGCRGWGWPQWSQHARQGKRPDRVPGGAASYHVATGSNGHKLLAVHCIGHRRRVGSKARLEPPQLFPRLGIEGQEVAIGLTMEDKTTGGGG